MARFDRLTVLNTIVGRGIMTLFHDEDLDTVIEVATAVDAIPHRVCPDPSATAARERKKINLPAPASVVVTAPTRASRCV